MPHSTYLPEKMGTATVSPTGRFEAGSFQEFTVTYTAGYFGIDDSGSIKVVHRFASDMGRPQHSDPAAPNYTTVEASNGAVLHIDYDGKHNIRPWDKTLYIRVVRGYLREGDRIIVRFGDRRQGSPGIRVQTFCEETFEFRVLTDAIATCDYAELPDQPTIAIVAGPPVLFKAIAVAGALYLGWLGVQGLRAPILTLDGTQVAARTSPADRMSDLYGSGSRILGINPKVILLYLALLPSFVAPELGLPELQLAILGLTIIAINIVWQGFLVAAAGHMRRWLQSDAMQRAVSRATGAILIAFAVAMVWSNLGRNLAA